MPDSPNLPRRDGREYDPLALELASMIADHLRGIEIRADELSPDAHRLVAAYVAKRDYGGAAASGRFGGAQVRFRARMHTGEPLPEVPNIDRPARGRVIDAEPAEQPRPGLPRSGQDSAAPGGV